MATFTINTVATEAFKDQKPGTSGLRKKVAVFKAGHYLHNFVQATYNSLPADKLKGSTLVVGGDGRYWNKEALQIIIKISAGNGIGKLLIGQDGILSTPAVSAIIRARHAYGALILTASHNPGGPENDFGIKYNISNGGPAPEAITNAIYDHTLKIKEFKTADLPDIDLSKLGKHTWQGFEVEVIDSVDDYLHLMQSVFDFAALKKLIARPDFKFVYDSMSGVTGVYTRRIFADVLGASADSLMNAYPAEDFNGHHPDPNLTYAHELVERVYKGDYELGAASDGDGDRNMILGRAFFVNPSDSVAVIAANASAIPYFRSGLKGLARSMPTSAALDRVAKDLGVEFFEVPTGWKFFGNLMDAGKLSICGEESFGTGSDHIREKDGIWAVLSWLSILASRNPDSSKPFVGVAQVVREHWAKYGRNFFSRYDYEEVSSKDGDEVMRILGEHVSSGSLVGKTLTDDASGTSYVVAATDNFEYTDPIDKSVSKNQGLRILFKDGSRIIYRLSGTGSSGATIRVYFDAYDNKNVDRETADALRPLISIGLKLGKIVETTKRESPTVIT
jgi:phosphoglucomutase